MEKFHSEDEITPELEIPFHPETEVKIFKAIIAIVLVRWMVM